MQKELYLSLNSNSGEQEIILLDNYNFSIELDQQPLWRLGKLIPYGITDTIIYYRLTFIIPKKDEILNKKILEAYSLSTGSILFRIDSHIEYSTAHHEDPIIMCLYSLSATVYPPQLYIAKNKESSSEQNIEDEYDDFDVNDSDYLEDYSDDYDQDE